MEHVGKSEYVSVPGYSYLDLNIVKERTDKSYFSNEKQITDFLCHKMDTFLHEIFNEETETVKREFRFSVDRMFGTGTSPRIDLLVSTKSGDRIGIECKYMNRPNIHVMAKAIGQILTYAVSAENMGMKIDRFVIVTNKICGNEIDVIRRFSLPIDICVLNNGFLAKLVQSYE